MDDGQSQNTTSPIPEPIVKPVEVKKSFPILTVILVLFLILSLAGTGYLAYQNMQLTKQITQMKVTPIPTAYVSPNPISYTSPTPTSTADPTAGWKSYTWQGFSFKYPNDWDLNTRNSIGSIEELVVTPKNQPNDPGVTSLFVEVMTEDQNIKYNLNIDMNTNTQFEEWLNKPASNNTQERKFKLVNSKLGDLDAVQFVSQTLSGDPTEPSYNVNTWLNKDKVNYYFVLGPDKERVNQFLPIYNQILSTFKFTN